MMESGQAEEQYYKYVQHVCMYTPGVLMVTLRPSAVVVCHPCLELPSSFWSYVRI